MMLEKVESFKFRDEDETVVIHLVPQDDITPLEAVRVAELMTQATMPDASVLGSVTTTPYTIQAMMDYIKANGIERHFNIEEN